PGDRGRLAMISLRFHIRFPEDKIKEPIVYQIGHEYKVVTNVRRADVRETTGWMDLELTGDTAEIERAVEGLRKKGVAVDPIELNVVE
ncbi:MAG: NIL domain-containing protein, partial [Nitrospira sp.]|nr:NIL domain-containing protein [Nitrospira sp.]